MSKYKCNSKSKVTVTDDASQAPLPKQPQIQRYKLAWRAFMIANLGLGGYMFSRIKQKNASQESEETPVKARSPSPPSSSPPPPAPPATTTPADAINFFEEQEFMPSRPIADLMKVHGPISEEQQREIFEWILEEKRKIKPTSKYEKKRIDQEKAILKEFILAEWIPPL